MTFEATGPTSVKRITAPEQPADTVSTRFAGELRFQGGFPTEETLRELYDRLDFQRGCQAFLRHMMAAAVWGFYRGLRRDLGVADNDLAILHLDANGLVLTGNSETIYGIGILDTKPGPLVVEVPPRVLGLLNDQWMRPMGDLGIAGPDRGEGGKYLLLPPAHDGEVPDGFVEVIRLRTYRQWLVMRAFMGRGGDPAPGMQALYGTRIYPLAQADEPPANNHTGASRKPFDTIHPTDIRYFEDLAEMVDYEPLDAISAEESAELAQIGIRKGEPFAPDARLRGILDEAAKVGSFMAFSLANAPRADYLRYPDRQWYGNVAGYPTFVDEQGRPMIDAMVEMAWFGTGRAQAMAGAKVGVGSAYSWEYRDKNGDWIDTSRTYKLRLPGPIPAKDFWSVVVYDLWTRSMLANGQPFPSLNSYADGIQQDEDGGVTVYIGPEPPGGKEGNWIRTLPDVGWFPVIRLYGPLESWIDRTWKPDDVELVD
jgi:hypothetical protein